MSARLSTHNAALIAHTILGSPIPALPMPITPSVPLKADGRKANGRKANPNAPWCLQCHVNMKQTRGPNGKRWTCRVCQQNSVYQRTVGEPRGGGPWGKHSSLSHPCCIQCRASMAKHSKGIWRCKPCGVYPQAHRKLTMTTRKRTASGRLRTATGKARTKKHSPRYVLKMDFPQCVPCRWQMKQTGTVAKRRWECSLCGASCYKARTANRKRPLTQSRVDGDALLRLVSKVVPRDYLSREDTIQELVLLVLAGELHESDVTPFMAKRISRACLKRQSDYRDISLETQNSEGVRIFDRLAG